MGNPKAAIQRAEEYLEYYRELKHSIKRIDRELLKLQYDGLPKLPGATVITDMPTSHKHRPDALEVAYRITSLIDCRHETAKVLEEIDDALDFISSKQGQSVYGELLRMWYVDKLTKEEICDKLKYSERWLYSIKDKALKSFAVALYGTKAI